MNFHSEYAIMRKPPTFYTRSNPELQTPTTYDSAVITAMSVWHITHIRVRHGFAPITHTHSQSAIRPSCLTPHRIGVNHTIGGIRRYGIP